MGGRPARRHDHLGRRARRRADGRAGRLDRARRGAADPVAERHRRRRPRDRARRDRPARVGYESNDASVLTNVSSDHLDLQGIHTLPELAEVKSTICRITKPDGWVVLNADDPLSPRSPGGSRPRSPSSRSTRARPSSGATSRRRGPGLLVLRAGWLVEAEGERDDPTSSRSGACRSRSAGWRATTSPMPSPPPAAARGLGATLEQVRDGLADFRPSAERSPGRLNLYRLGRPRRHRRLRPQRGRASRPSSTSPRGSPPAPRVGPRRSPRSSGRPATGRTTRCAGSGGSRRSGRSGSRSSRRSLPARPDRGVRGRRAARRVSEGRWRQPRRRPGLRARRRRRSGRSSTARPATGRTAGGRMAPRVIVLMCHEEREAVFELLATLGARPVDVASELTELVPRLQGRPRRRLSPRRSDRPDRSRRGARQCPQDRLVRPRALDGASSAGVGGRTYAPVLVGGCSTMEMAIGIALMVIAALEIIGILSGWCSRTAR